MENLERVIAALNGKLLHVTIEVPCDEDIYGTDSFDVHYSPLSRSVEVEAYREGGTGKFYRIVTRRLAAYLDKVG